MFWVLLVLAAQADVEDDEEAGHQGRGADTNVEPGVVGEDPVLVVVRVVVEVLPVDSRLQGEVPGAKLVPHVRTSLCCVGQVQAR